MPEEKNHILQLTDELTGREAAVRIHSEDVSLPLNALLDKYLKNPPIEQFLNERRITNDSAEHLQDLQDFVYISSDGGQLHEPFDGVAFKQDDATIDLDDVPCVRQARVSGTPVALIDITIDRMNVGYERNWDGFHKRRWDRHAHIYSDFVLDSLREMYSEAEANEVVRLETTKHKLDFVRALARKIWHSDFENYSRFIGDKVPYKTGDETVRNIINGGGGICSEKVQAMKFITDHYGLRSEYVLAGADARDPVPEDKLRELLTTFDFRFSKRYMRYWQHVALLYTIDETEILFDVTNGNIPFMSLMNDRACDVLGYKGKLPVKVRMTVQDEDFYYHRVSQDIPEKLFFAMEGWLQDVDLIQVFDNELGLYISRDYFITPIVYKTSKAFEDFKQQYVKVSEDAGLPCSVSPDWSLESGLGQKFMEDDPSTSEKILLARDHLLERYEECHGSGHEAGLIIIGLRETNENV